MNPTTKTKVRARARKKPMVRESAMEREAVRILPTRSSMRSNLRASRTTKVRKSKRKLLQKTTVMAMRAAMALTSK